MQINMKQTHAYKPLGGINVNRDNASKPELEIQLQSNPRLEFSKILDSKFWRQSDF